MYNTQWLIGREETSFPTSNLCQCVPSRHVGIMLGKVTQVPDENVPLSHL